MTHTAVPLVDNEILPYWDADSKPYYYNRTGTPYQRVEWKPFFQARGLYNPILTNLVPYLPSGAIIAGGFLGSVLSSGAVPSRDIDIFFTSGEVFRKVYDLFNQPPNDVNSWPLHSYKPSMTLENLNKCSKLTRVVELTPSNTELVPVQLIKMIWYEDAESVIDSFDFTTCQFAIDGNDLVFNPVSFLDLFNRKLVRHRAHPPIEIFYRIAKYAKKGFSVPRITALQLIEDIKNSSALPSESVY